jgi:hypothetical protein
MRAEVRSCTASVYVTLEGADEQLAVEETPSRDPSCSVEV